MTRVDEFKRINQLQNNYVNDLIAYMTNMENNYMKEVNFTSDTGTGKTNMIALLINKMPECFFVVTSLSKGGLHKQIENKLTELCNHKNYLVYGVADYKSNSKLSDADILNLIPDDKKVIWLRDEGHINTNKWQELLYNKCWKVVNISATNKENSGVKCNFIETAMLRTVYQQNGTPEMALEKLIEIKKQHKAVKGYNPCAIMRVIDHSICDRIVNFCKKNSLTYISLIDESHNILKLCEDDNPIDVIINKFKIVEGIDIRRAHVLYMDNEPSNAATTIQVIGRCRRNALLYRNDVDIFKDKKLFDATKKCYVYYNVANMKIATDETGNLCNAFCNIISCEKLTSGSVVSVTNGELANGLVVAELVGQTGKFKIDVDPDTGFNVVNPASKSYETQSKFIEPKFLGYSKSEIYSRLTKEENINWATGEKYITEGCYLSKWNSFKAESLNLQIDINNILEKNKLYQIKKSKEGFYVQKYIPHLISFTYVNKKLSDIECKFVRDRNIEKIGPFKTKQGAARKCNSLNKLFDGKVVVYKNYGASLFTIVNHLYYHANENYRKPNCSEVYNVEPNKMADTQITVTAISTINDKTHWYEKSTIDEYFETNDFVSYNKVVNDKEEAILGIDQYKSIKGAEGRINWILDKAVTSKVTKYSKLNTFLRKKYESQINDVTPYLYNGKNNFNFNSKANACLGYCVEYYAKYLVYGEKYLIKQINKAKSESNVTTINDFIIIRACMLKYKENMSLSYGSEVAKLIHTIGVEQLIKDDYAEFVKTVIKFGTRTAAFIKKELYPTATEARQLYDPNLSTNHFSALCDFITKDKIVDIKCTSNITIEHVLQVLAYHYLSTKRDDLDIKELIIFDAVKNKYVRIKI